MHATSSALVPPALSRLPNLCPALQIKIGFSSEKDRAKQYACDLEIFQTEIDARRVENELRNGDHTVDGPSCCVVPLIYTFVSPSRCYRYFGRAHHDELNYLGIISCAKHYNLPAILIGGLKLIGGTREATDFVQPKGQE